MDYLVGIFRLVEIFSLLAVVPMICAVVNRGKEPARRVKYPIIFGWPFLVGICLLYVDGGSLADIVVFFKASDYWGIVDIVAGIAATEFIGAIVGGFMYEWIEKRM